MFLFRRPPLTKEERRRLVEEPPIPWKEWALTEALKFFVGAGLLILDSFVFVSTWDEGTSGWRMATIPLMMLSVYLNYLLWMFLWRVPSREETRAGTLKRTLLHPFPLGRWTPEYDIWKKGEQHKLHDLDVNPREFL